MDIERQLISYSYESRDLKHHILYVHDQNKKILLSAVNLFLYERCTSSTNTSERYSQVLIRFFRFLIKRIPTNENNPNFWRSATCSEIREWQAEQVRERALKKCKKPRDDTIFYNASLVLDFYVWARKKGFPTLINATSQDWKFNYKNESKIFTNKNILSGSSPDTANIDIGKIRSRKHEKYKRSKITIMSNSDIKLLMESYSDKVYPAMLLLALSTGLRSEGCCSFPYIGYGKNSHIRVYPDIINNIEDMNGSIPKTFSYTVIEKGSKKRTLKVNLSAWKSICQFYYPLYLERRKKFIKKHPEKKPDNYFFLTSKGDPVTPKKISDATNHIKKERIKGFNWSFRNSRDWYATNFMIHRLSKKQVENFYYDNSVDKALQDQLGHQDLVTTYMYYIRVASLILKLNSGELDYTLGKSDGFWDSLAPK